MVQGKMIAAKLLMSLAGLAMTLSTVAPAGAVPPAPREDVFHTNTGSSFRQNRPHGSVPSAAEPNPEQYAPRANITRGSSPQQWFEAMDNLVGYYRPNVQDHFILDKPFNNEVERVTQYCNTLCRIAKNYRILAQKLKSLPVIDQMPQSKILRDNLVDWYNDSALVYEDMYKPRPPARTQEELHRMLRDITDRSEGLKNSYATIWGMDNDLRLKMAVNQPRIDNALMEYAEKARPEYMMQHQR